jgi:hypothetical protein
MSAIKMYGQPSEGREREPAWRMKHCAIAAHIDCPRGIPGEYPTMTKLGLLMGGLVFFGSLPPGDEPPAPRDADIYADSFAFDGQVPESCIDQYIGHHPDRLVEGFAAMPKPKGCDWMSGSVVKSITNHKGTILVQLV